MNIYQNCFINIDDSDVLAVQEALRDSSISGKGPAVARFEKRLSDYYGSPYALCCSNGTAAIQMVLMMEGIQEGDEVLLPPTAPVMSVLPIVALGATPVFVDTH